MYRFVLISFCAAVLVSSSATSQWQKVKNAKLGVSYRMPKKYLESVPINEGRRPPHLEDQWKSIKKLHGKHGTYSWAIEVYRFVKADDIAITGTEKGGTKTAEEKLKEMLRRRGQSKSFGDWIKNSYQNQGINLTTKGKKQKGRLPYGLWEGSRASQGVMWMYMAACYDMKGHEIAIVGHYPKAKERTIKKVVKKAISSVEIFEGAASSSRGKIEGEEFAKVEGDSEFTEKRRKWLEDAANNIKGNKGWDVFCTKYYIVLYSFDANKRARAYKFAKHLARRMDEMQLQYRKRFPPHDKMTKWWSVFRVCRNKSEFDVYGGTSGGVVGWYNPGSKELVVFNAKKLGLFKTEAVAYHEGWHQYADFWFPGAKLHRWFDEGTGDFFGGMKRVGAKKWIPGKSKMRTSTIKELVNTQRTVALKEIVRWHKDKFYGAGATNFYAQGWSMVDFFTRGQKTPGWNKSWNKILSTYIDVALETKDTNKAVDVAFKDVDWDKLEKAWKHYVKRVL